MQRRILSSCVVLLVLFLAACGPGNAAPAADVPAGENAGQPGGQPEVQAGEPALPPEPLEIEFQATDGQTLSGLYYPAAVNPAPLVVFMHWVNGDRGDWYEIAPWLQNRGLVNPFPSAGEYPWLDPAWFPPVPPDASYGVFLFSFRGCDGSGCAGWQTDEWLLDAQAAAAAALTLPGVDPARIAFIGSSIGADGAIDGCAWLAENHPGACRGALSLSPGGYLNVLYAQAVERLGQADPAIPAWCLAEPGEIFFCNTALDSGNAALQVHEIPGGGHGNSLLSPGLDPLPMQLILDFLSETIAQD